MNTKTKVTFAVPAQLQQELREKVTKDGYGLRGKSKWVSEAIHSFLKIKNYQQYVQYNDEMSSMDKIDTVVIEQKLNFQLNDAILATRKLFPMLEGVKSRIIRSAIIQRLLRK